MSLFFCAALRHENSRLLHARLARQGFARHLILFEAGFAPRAPPCVDELLIVWGMFIDKLKESGLDGRFLFVKGERITMVQDIFFGQGYHTGRGAGSQWD